MVMIGVSRLKRKRTYCILKRTPLKNFWIPFSDHHDIDEAEKKLKNIIKIHVKKGLLVKKLDNGVFDVSDGMCPRVSYKIEEC